MRALAACLLILPAAAAAHHNFNAIFDGERIVELEGEVTEVLWRNPHVLYSVRASDGRIWDIETAAVAVLSRMDVPPDVIEAGDRIRFAGNPARGDRAEMFARHARLPSGEEVVFQPHLTPRWTSRVVGTFDTWRAREGDGSRPDLGIFRVWSQRFAPDQRGLFPEIRRPSAVYEYPLTDAARAALERFDSAEDSVRGDCEPAGMPVIMGGPLPREFVDEGDRILLRMEGWARPRTVHMDRTAPPDDVPSSPLGYSVGRWDGDALVVTTTHVDFGYFNTIGVPLSRQAEIVERFAPSDDGSRLDYTMRVTDPATFTETVELEKHWIWLPDNEVQSIECIA